MNRRELIKTSFGLAVALVIPDIHDFDKFITVGEPFFRINSPGWDGMWEVGDTVYFSNACEVHDAFYEIARICSITGTEITFKCDMDGNVKTN